jgi:hypothetical protein
MRTKTAAVAEAPVKRKKKRVTALAVVPAPPRRGMSKLDDADVSSIVADSRHEIQQMLEDSDNDSASALMKKRMLQMLTDLLPFAETAVRNSKGAKGVYQINSLITSIRELLIDIKSDQDRGQIGHLMVEQIVRPAFLDVGMAIVQENDNFLRTVREYLQSEDYRSVKAAHQESLKAISVRIQAEYKLASEKAVAFMQK